MFMQALVFIQYTGLLPVIAIVVELMTLKILPSGVYTHCTVLPTSPDLELSVTFTCNCEV